MKGDVEIVDELHELDSVLKSFPPEAHWFCPKRKDDDTLDYANPDEGEEDTSAETKREFIRDAKKRSSVAYKYSLILGLAPEQTGGMLGEYTQKLNRLLSTCDKCVYNWHAERRAYLKGLSEQFDDEVVAEFSKRLNMLDFDRLDNGLQIGQGLLTEADPTQRTQNYIAQHDASALIALYEALCCIDYHKDDGRLQKHFDYVFETIQARKVLRLSETLPAMARFLFSQNVVRLRFATVSWQKMNDSLTAKSFEWVVHDVLYENIVLISHPNAHPNDIERFWLGFLLMLDKMDEDLISHSLCAMEVQPDIYKLALQHLSCNSENIALLVIQALQILLQKAPKTFWSAMGSISPSTIAELIFKSPGFNLMLQNPRTFDDIDSSPATSWITNFLNSLVPAQKYEACRTVVLYSFERLQLSHFSESVKTSCVAVGLGALHTTLQTFTHQDYHINATSSLIIIGELMKVVEPFMNMIVACAELQDDSASNSELKRRARLVIQDALTLDCKAINVEYHAHAGEAKVNVQRGARQHSQGIWQAALDIFRPGNIELAKSILPAITSLIGLDELLPASKKHPEKMPPDQIQFNKDFHELMDNIARIIERLSDFTPADLNQLCQSSATARPLFAALISADQGISEAAVEVIKTMTDEIGKVDAMQRLLETAFVPMLSSLTYAENLISKAETFGSTPYVVKTGRELLKSLCGNTGVLRARGITFSSQERSLTLQWWKMQWHILDRIFSLTESWSPKLSKSTEYMQDFIRDCMEYAEELFDNYSVFASALRAPSPSPGQLVVDIDGNSRDAIVRVLDIICRNVNGLVGMLRLRDHYLISVATKLLVKLLGCLGEYDLEIDEFAAKFIKASCRSGSHEGFKRTNLTEQQKAELQRALYENQGVAIINDSKSTVKKQISLDAWSKSADGKQYEPKIPVTGTTQSASKHGPSTSGSKGKSALEMMRTREAVAAKANSHNIDAFKERRRAEEEASKKLKAEAIAKARALRAPVGGSGLRDISGAVGKEHMPDRSEIMVSSDESSDEDDDEEESNALIKAQGQRNKKVSEYEESRRRALKQSQGPVKKQKVQRSAKDLRARVEPNMDRLYLEILNWEIFHTGQDPPSNSECRRIDNKYLDLDLYKMTFGPLLISEVWRSLVTAKDEANYKPVEIKILNRLSVDKFIEVSTSMPMAFNKELKLAERDIVVLGQSPDPMNNQQAPHCLARVDRTTRKKDVLEVTYRISRDVKVSLLQCLVPNGKAHCVKIADMTTTQREYAALSSLEYYDLCTEVLEAKPSPLQKYPEEKINNMSGKYKLNRGQANAILSATDNDGFTLIQGPPGSGKTKTIVAMVGAILTPILQQQQADQAKLRPQPGQNKVAITPPKKKLLICAPSNAAVDELVLRLKDGIQPLNGPHQKISVIRIGRSDAINASVKDVMLDELVRLKLEGDNGEKNKLINDRDNLHKDAAKIKERLNEVRPALDQAQKSGDKKTELELRREFDDLKRKQAHIGAKIDEDKESGNTVTRQNEINRRRFQQEIIDGAHVLCATLSGSGHDMFRNLNVEFETVIIDEAAQCIELSALIPLKYGCSKCILVGDPEQLPPTVLSRSAQSFGYEQSLFVRMQMNHPKDVHLLDTQYRMHPEISVFPSKQFYGGRLIDGSGMARLRDQPWHASTILGPYRFFDVKGVQTQEARGHSFINVPELNAAIGLYQRLKADFSSYDFTGKIGIIATYKAQLNELRFRFERKFGSTIFEEIEFNTTDAFQGREREIIIFSCVRAKATGGIGFLSDIRRMNVGLTRAKSSLWVLGDSNALQQGEFWNRLIQDAKERDRYTGGDVIRLLQQPTTRDRQSLREQQIKSEPQVKSESSVRRPSVSQATSSRNIAEDRDIEMIDAPSVSSSRKSSIASGSSSAVSMVQRPRKGPAGLDFQTGPLRTPSLESHSTESAMASGTSLHSKRSLESPTEDRPSKKTTPKPESDLEKAFKAQQASKGASAPLPRPVRPAGVAPPRKKAPADPFIQKKRPPPKR